MFVYVPRKTRAAFNSQSGQKDKPILKELMNAYIHGVHPYKGLFMVSSKFGEKITSFIDTSS